MAFDVMSGFQVGQQIAGPNALGVFVQNLMAQINQRMTMQQQIGGQVELQRRLRETDPEARFKSKLYGQAENQLGTQGLSGVDSNAMMRNLLGLGKSPEQIAADAQAQKTGEGRAPTPPLNELEQARLDTERQKQAKVAKGIFGLGFGGTPVPGKDRIRVRKKSTGETGTLLSGEFNPNEYDRL